MIVWSDMEKLPFVGDTPIPCFMWLKVQVTYADFVGLYDSYTASGGAEFGLGRGRWALRPP